MNKSIEKTLTKNDTGETGGHQAGIVVPRSNLELIEFFPPFDLSEFNPDTWITCIDPNGDHWDMRYVYYNGKTFTPPKSTRNEYRITHMTKYFSKWGAKCGDSVVFSSTKNSTIFNIRIKIQGELVEVRNSSVNSKPVVLRGWRTVF